MYEIKRMKPIAPNSLDGYRDKAISRALDAYLYDSGSPKVLFKIGRSLHDTRVRDTLLWHMLHEDAETLGSIGEFATRVAETMHVEDAAPALTIGALAMWGAGREAACQTLALASVMADPDYSLMQLLVRARIEDLPYATWASAMNELSLDDCRYGKGKTR